MYNDRRHLSAPGAGTGETENKQKDGEQAAVSEGDVQPQGIFRVRKDSTSKDQGQI